MDYRYSIAVENYIDDLYFTEKLLNCFATGTIPIYIGAKNIGSKFNLDGIIQSSPNSILEDIEICSKEHYLSKMDAIRDNLERCKEFMTIEDYIIDNYFEVKE
jgi:hypothetical protein